MKNILFIALMIPFTLFAAPDSTTKFLMTDRMSMLDWGLYKVEKAVEEILSDINDKKITIFVRTDYIWDEDRIKVNLSKYQEEVSKSECRYSINTVKLILKDEESLFQYFEHSGFEQNKNRPKNIKKELYSKVQVNVKLQNNKLMKVINCRAMLKSTGDVYFSE